MPIRKIKERIYSEKAQKNRTYIYEDNDCRLTTHKLVRIIMKMIK